MRTRICTAVPVLVLSVSGGGGAAQVAPIPMFSGELQEDYETFTPGALAGPAPIFGGAATLTSTGTSLFIVTPGTFGLDNNGVAQPYSGIQAFGNNSATELAIIAFATPVTRFGGYWSHSTRGVNRFELTFKDSSGAVIDFVAETVADPSGSMHWFGWSSPIPIASIEIGGRFAVNDLLQASFHTPCYANCDFSTTQPILNVEDFICFVGAFAAATALPQEHQQAHYANCDQSTTPPVLNVEDFICFVSAFAQGCP